MELGTSIEQAALTPRKLPNVSISAYIKRVSPQAKTAEHIFMENFP